MGLCECLILFLQLSEQPHILDGDDGLVGEGLEEADLLLAERAYVCSTKLYRPDRRPLPQQRNAELSSVTYLPSHGTSFGKLLVGLNIGRVNG
jgi:hypothetical protein